MKCFLFIIVFCALSWSQILPKIPDFKPNTPDTAVFEATTTDAKDAIDVQSSIIPKLGMTLERIEKESISSLDDYQVKNEWLKEEIIDLERKIENDKKSAEIILRPLEPKGEFEKLGDFEKRQSKWFEERDLAWEKATKDSAEKLIRLQNAKVKIDDEVKDFVAHIELNSHPLGAEVFLNKEFVGTTPFKKIDLEPNKYLIKLQKVGYQSQVFSLEVKKGAEIEKFLELKKEYLFKTAQGVSLDSLSAQTGKSEKDYSERIAYIDDWIIEVEKEYLELKKVALSEVTPLAPKGEFEKTEDFEKRQKAFNHKNLALTKDIDEAYSDFKKMVKTTRNKIENHQLEFRYQVSKMILDNAKMTLGTYNADTEKMPLKLVIDSEGHNAEFIGEIHADIPLAKKIKEKPFDVSNEINYYNWKVKVDDQFYYVGYKKLNSNYLNSPLKISGEFSLSPIIAKDSIVIAAQMKLHSMNQNNKSTWYQSPWLKWSLLAIGSGLAGYAIVIDQDIQKDVDAFAPVNANDALARQKTIRDKESKRNIVAGASAFILATDIILWTF